MYVHPLVRPRLWSSFLAPTAKECLQIYILNDELNYPVRHQLTEHWPEPCCSFLLFENISSVYSYHLCTSNSMGIESMDTKGENR